MKEHVPQWYTYEHHQKGELGSQEGGQEQADELLMLHKLLQEYAPLWYTQEHDQKAKLALQHPKRAPRLPRPKAKSLSLEIYSRDQQR